MHSRHLPLTELVTLAYLGALVIALSLVGCQSESPPETETPRIEQTARTGALRAAPASQVAAPAFEILTTPIDETPRIVTFEEAEAAYNDDRFDEASSLFSSYLDTRPENPFGHYMLGLSSQKAGALDQAETSLRRALELDSTHVRSWQNLARVFLDSGRPGEAFDALESGRVLDPENGATYRLLGRTLHQQGNPSEAADAYREAILIDESDAWAMNNLALVLLEEGQHRHAAETLAQATVLRPTQALFLNNLGMALEQAREFASARDAYAKAVAVKADYERAALNLARLDATDLIEMGPVVVEDLAARFLEELESWRDEHVARELGEEEASSLADVANIQ
jgi:Flp pilus assembly protein TadD